MSIDVSDFCLSFEVTLVFSESEEDSSLDFFCFTRLRAFFAEEERKTEILLGLLSSFPGDCDSVDEEAEEEEEGAVEDEEGEEEPEIEEDPGEPDEVVCALDKGELVGWLLT